MFRKGAVLLTTEEMESEYDGEELRKEVRLLGLDSYGISGMLTASSHTVA